MELFQGQPMTAFKRSKNMKEINGGTSIKIDEVKKFNISSKKGKCTPKLSGARRLWV